MLIKLGVDISRLEPEIRRVLPYVEKTYQEFRYEPVITSTYEGNHSPGSLHYNNDAVDIRAGADQDMGAIHYRLKERLGPDYDIIRHKTHIHIEYDPK